MGTTQVVNVDLCFRSSEIILKQGGEDLGLNMADRVTALISTLSQYVNFFL